MPKIHRDVPDAYADAPRSEQMLALKRAKIAKSVFIIPTQEPTTEKSSPSEQE